MSSHRMNCRWEVAPPGAIRTRNLEIRSLSLCPLSYGGAGSYESDSIPQGNGRLLDRQHTLDETLDDWPIGFALPVLHRVVVKVPVEFFGREETGFQQRVFTFIGDANYHPLERLVASMRPATFLCDGHDCMCSGAPKFLRSLEDVALVEFAIGGHEKLARSLDVFSR